MTQSALASKMNWDAEEAGSGGVVRPQSFSQRSEKTQEIGTSPWLPTLTAAFVFGLAAGTGGANHAGLLEGKTFRIAPVEARRSRDNESTQAIQIQRVADQLSQIQDAFGLNISELAAVLHVQRPTIYQWQKGTKLRPKNARRLGELHAITTYLQGQGFRDVGRNLHMPREGGPSLFDLLRSDTLNADEVLAATRWGTDTRKRQQRLRERITAVAAEHGFAELSKDEQQRNLEQNSSEIS